MHEIVHICILQNAYHPMVFNHICLHVKNLDLLGCDTVLLDGWVPTAQRIASSSSESQAFLLARHEGTMILCNIRNQPPNDTL
jgi:hypothetical protein